MPWLRGVNWQFYEHLYARYFPIEETPHSILWKLNSSEVESKLRYLGTENLNLRFLERTSLNPPPKAKMGYLNVDYRINRPLSFLPMMGTLGTFAFSLGGTIYNGEIQTISPEKNSLEIPIYLDSKSRSLEITPIYNSPRLFTSIKFESASISWFSPTTQGAATFEKSLK
jgi:hypothetical protein